MKRLVLRHPVHALDNKLLLPAGSELSAETMGALVAPRRKVVVQKCSLLHFGTTRDDVARLLAQPPYLTIFNSPEAISEVLCLMEQVEVILPFREALDYFRVKDFYTYRHMLAVFALSTTLARVLLTDYLEQAREMATGPTHDFGKFCVPAHILKKETPLTGRERAVLAEHTLAGYVLLCYYHGDAEDVAARVARDHHERKDGSGYPRGIRLEDFLVEIVAVCDIFDALISPRPYRPSSYDNRTAIEEITAMAERGEVSWDVVKALVALNRKKKKGVDETVVSLQKRGVPPPCNLYGITAGEDEEEGSR